MLILFVFVVLFLLLSMLFCNLKIQYLMSLVIEPEVKKIACCPTFTVEKALFWYRVSCISSSVSSTKLQLSFDFGVAVFACMQCGVVVSFRRGGGNLEQRFPFRLKSNDNFEKKGPRGHPYDGQTKMA